MMDNAYDPRDRRITLRTQAAAWVFCALLLASAVAFGGLIDQGEAGQQVAVSESAGYVCG